MHNRVRYFTAISLFEFSLTLSPASSPFSVSLFGRNQIEILLLGKSFTRTLLVNVNGNHNNNRIEYSLETNRKHPPSCGPGFPSPIERTTPRDSISWWYGIAICMTVNRLSPLEWYRGNKDSPVYEVHAWWDRGENVRGCAIMKWKWKWNEILVKRWITWFI